MRITKVLSYCEDSIDAAWKMATKRIPPGSNHAGAILIASAIVIAGNLIADAIHSQGDRK